MRNQDSVFTTLKTRIRVPTRTAEWALIPIGDMHYGNNKCDIDRLKDTVQYGKSLMKKMPVYFVLMGDELDITSKAERAALGASKLHDSTYDMIDIHVRTIGLELLKLLEPLKGHTLAVVEGNHKWVFSQAYDKYDIRAGETNSQWLARQLKAQWAGFLSYLRICVDTASCAREVSTKNEEYHVDIVACHGKGGAKLLGTSVNQVNDLRTIFPTADVYMFGHDHQKLAVPVSCLQVSAHSPRFERDQPLIVKERMQFLCRTGSFQRGYVPNESSFVVGGLFRPSVLGVIELRICCRSRSTTMENGRANVLVTSIKAIN